MPHLPNLRYVNADAAEGPAYIADYTGAIPND
jgi:hypothetical protein